MSYQHRLAELMLPHKFHHILRHVIIGMIRSMCCITMISQILYSRYLISHLLKSGDEITVKTYHNENISIEVTSQSPISVNATHGKQVMWFGSHTC